MSYQEERLQEIADAIREVKGTTEKIPATNFASEIVGLSVVKPSGIITIKENGSHNVANYEWAEVSVEPALREKDIIGTWVSSDGFSMSLQPNGVANVGGMSGTYEIFGNQVIINIPENEPITLTYNSDTETLTFETLVFSRVEDIREKDIVGKWLMAEGNLLNFKTGGVVLQELNGIETSTGTYEISGMNIIATLTGFLNITLYFNYNEETDTLYEPYQNITLTRVQETANLITKEITENGTYKASDDGADGYSEVVVNVAGSGGADSSEGLKTLYLFCGIRDLYTTNSYSGTKITIDNTKNKEIVLSENFNPVNATDASYMFYKNTGIVKVPALNTKSVTNMDSMFYGCSGLSEVGNLNTISVTNMKSMFSGCGNLKTIGQMDTSKVTNMGGMFYGCKQALTTIPQLDTSSVTNMDSMFYDCGKLTTIPLLDTSKVTTMYGMFSNCHKLTTIPPLDTSSVTSIDRMFYNCQGSLTTIPPLNTSKVTGFNMFAYMCKKLTTIEGLDLISATNVSSIVESCAKLTNLTLKNIKKSGLTIGSGTSYGHLLTLDSLVNTIKELWAYTSGSYTLTMGTANTAKLADVYVKLVTPTEEQIANDPNINSKMPCEVCASTDEGAMLITDYATLKKWTIA